MTTKKLYAKADITDWRDEAFQAEFVPKDKEDILDAIETGMNTAQVARATVVSREIKEAPDDIIRENKVLLQVGAMQDISQIVVRQKTDVDTKSGKTWHIPAFVGSNEGDNGQSYVPNDSYQARERAERYLKRQGIGHIKNRLAVIYQTGGDVKETAKQLKIEIDKLVRELV
jgi:hypothetical protein